MRPEIQADCEMGALNFCQCLAKLVDMLAKRAACTASQQPFSLAAARHLGQRALRRR